MNLILVVIVALAAISVGWLLFERAWDRRLFKGDHVNVRARAARELLERKPELQVLDVRSPREFSGGALPRAINISLGEPRFGERLERLDRGRPVLVYCAGGYRSRKVVAILRQAGFRMIYHLHRGFHSWRIAGLPVAQSGSRSPLLLLLFTAQIASANGI